MSEDKRMERFLRSIHIDDTDSFDLSFSQIHKSSTNNKYYYVIKKETPWTYESFDRFLNALSTINNYEYQIEFIYDGAIDLNSLSAFIKDWYHDKTDEDLKAEFSLDKRELNISFEKTIEEKKFSTYREDLNNLLAYINYNFTISTTVRNPSLKEEEAVDDNKAIFDWIGADEGASEEEKAQKITEQLEKERKQSIEAQNDDLIKSQEQIELERKAEKLNKARYKTSGSFHKVDDLNNLDDTYTYVEVTGMAFDVQDKLRTVGSGKNKGKKSMTFGLVNDTGAIYCYICESENISLDFIKGITEKRNYTVRGSIYLDRSSNKEYQINIQEIEEAEDSPLRDDNAKVKRVELHLHTNMSEMDGINSAEEYIRLASHMGHNAVAITDHAVVQAFPEAMNASKKYNMKVLYGVEVYMIDDYLKGGFKPADRNLEDATYIVFDLESTGLSVKYDKIIEFGAVKIQNGREIDRLNILINPEIEIREEITAINNISNEMVKDSPTIKEALPIILDFIKDGIMVSHNLEFDYLLLNQAMVDNGFGELKNPGVDTLAVSRFLFPSKRGHRLGDLAKELKVEYDTISAHRAEYDAEVLGYCWEAMIKLLAEKGIKNHKDIINLEIPNAYLKHIINGSYHTVILLKNQKGLQDLYRIISTSHVETLGYYPFVKRSLIEKYRENFLVGSACYNGEVFYSSYRRNKEELAKAISFYDYIEIQPITNYSFLVLNKRHDIPSFDLLKQYILDIIEEAENQKKIIVATGDVHYLNPSDKKYRDVLIESPAVKKRWHPLSHGMSDAEQEAHRQSGEKFEYFPNPDQHFKTTNEMLEDFAWLGKDKAYEYVVTNTNKIADMISYVRPIPEGLYPPKIDNCEQTLRDICFGKAHELYGDPLPELIEQRLNTELNGIISNGYSVIYYISHLLVKESNERGYLVGSRGSVGSSLAATMAGITEVNPLPPHYRCPKCKHTEFPSVEGITSGFDLEEKCCPVCGTKMISDGQSIPFETFLGFNADKTPDIDLNFPTDFQAEAHLILKRLLGEKHVFRAGTISTVQLKTAIGNVTKSFLPRIGVDPSTVKRATINELAYGTTGAKRTTGQHPGGIVVVPNEYEVNYFTPVQYPADEDDDPTWQTTHFDYNALHETLLKFDMLGHVDPQALKMMSDLTGVDGRKVPFNDKKVLSIFSSDDALNLKHKYMHKDNGALGLPEFGTEFVRQLLRETNPKTFGDLLIISGLSHGTDVWTNNAQKLLRDGTVSSLNDVIGCRDDIMSYLISKGMDKSESFEIMERVRKGKHLTDDEVKDMKAHDVPDYYIESCSKIAYLFPRGHACAYVMMAVRVAYYKVYYPLEYYATYFTLRCSAYDVDTMIGGIDAIYNKLVSLEQRRNSKINQLSPKEKELIITLSSALEMYERGYKFENIDLKRSKANDFVIDKENQALIIPFKTLDGLGENGAVDIENARNERPFSSLQDFKNRTKANKNVINKLTQLGCFDNLQQEETINLFDFMF